MSFCLQGVGGGRDPNPAHGHWGLGQVAHGLGIGSDGSWLGKGVRWLIVWGRERSGSSWSEKFVSGGSWSVGWGGGGGGLRSSSSWSRG